MKVLVGKKSFMLVLLWAQRGLLACAILMLGYCGFVLLDTWMFQRRERQALEHLLHEKGQAPSPPPESPSIPRGSIGRLEIQRLGVSVIVTEGTGQRTIRRAAGHIGGTALPGQPGNIGIAGHRDTFFRPLRNIQRGDIITLTTAGGEYRYRVVATSVVSPYDVAVLESDGNEILTLVTCYPFYFVGPAPQRFVVRATRIS